jgi:glutamyl/glutaminyl-tRNA synthetase
VFERERLRRFNKEAVRAMETERLFELVYPRYRGLNTGWLREALEAVKGDLTTLSDVPVLLAPFVEYELTEEAKGILSGKDAPRALKAVLEEVKKADSLDKENYAAVMGRLKERGLGGKSLLMPVRAALTGRTKGIELEKVFRLLGKLKVLERLSGLIK